MTMRELNKTNVEGEVGKLDVPLINGTVNVSLNHL